MKIVIIQLFLLLSSIAIVSSLPGQTAGEAIPISEGVTFGSLNEAESIWYSISLNGNYMISLDANVTTDFDMRLYNSSLQQVDSATGSSYPDVMDLFSYYGFHYIEITAFSGTGDFNLNISSFPVVPGDSERNPIAIIEGEYIGDLTSGNDFRWFTSELSGNYEIILLGETGTNFNLYLYNSDLQIVDSSYNSYYPETISHHSMIGKYYIKIISVGNSGTYNLTLASVPQIAGDHYLNPIELTSRSDTGILPGPSEDGTTWYSIECDGEYRIVLTASDDTDFDIYLYTPNLIQLESSKDITYPEIITTEYLFGTFLIEVVPYTGSGAYSLTVFKISDTSGSSAELAIEISEGNYTGFLPGSSEDFGIWYKIDLEGNYTVLLEASVDSDFDLIIYDSGLNLYEESNLREYPETIQLININQTFYIKIYPYGTTYGWYNLEIAENPIETSVISSISTSTHTGNEFSPNYLLLFILGLLIIAVMVNYKTKRSFNPTKKIKNTISNSRTRFRSRRVMALVCNACGTNNKDNSLFCIECGSSLFD